MKLRLFQGSEQEVSVVVSDRKVLVGQDKTCDLLVTHEAPEVLLELTPVPDSNPLVVLRKSDKELWFLPGGQAERHTLVLGHLYEMRPGDRIVLGSDWFSSSLPRLDLTFY